MSKRNGCTRAPDWIHPIGLQLYTVRAALRRDFSGTLARVAQIGYRDVELAGTFGRSASQVRTILNTAGLSAPSSHVELEGLESDLPKALEDAHTLGHRYLVVPSVPSRDHKTLDDYRRIGERLNHVAERLARGGIAIAYHNHAFEFTPIDGRLPYDVLLEATDPKRVKLEIDLYWMLHGGQDPLKYFSRWPGRVRLVHVKDSYGPPDQAMADVGAGIIDWQRIFAKREQAGIEHFFVERDNAPDELASAAASYQYLRSLSATPIASVAAGGRLKQSVARWTMDVPLPELCQRAKAIGLLGIDPLYPDEWALVREAGLTCSMGYASRRPRLS